MRLRIYSYVLCEHPGDPIGPEPSHDPPGQRDAWHEAFLALGPADGPDVHAMPDGRLWLIRDTYTVETCWRLSRSAKELRLVRLGAANAEADATRADAERKRPARPATTSGRAARALGRQLPGDARVVSGPGGSLRQDHG